MDIEKLVTFYERLEPTVNRIVELGRLDQPIKDEGWSPRQFIHHLADAQTQAFYRILWIVTENNTTIKPFDQDNWVNTTGSFPIEGSMAMLKGVYERWYHLMKDMDVSMYDKTAHHPEIGEVKIGSLTEYYINHGETHVSQFAGLAQE